MFAARPKSAQASGQLLACDAPWHSEQDSLLSRCEPVLSRLEKCSETDLRSHARAASTQQLRFNDSDMSKEAVIDPGHVRDVFDEGHLFTKHVADLSTTLISLAEGGRGPL